MAVVLALLALSALPSATAVVVLALDLLDDLNIAVKRFVGLMGQELVSHDWSVDKEAKGSTNRARSGAINGTLLLKDLKHVRLAVHAADKLIHKRLQIIVGQLGTFSQRQNEGQVDAGDTYVVGGTQRVDSSDDVEGSFAVKSLNLLSEENEKADDRFGVLNGRDQSQQRRTSKNDKRMTCIKSLTRTRR